METLLFNLLAIIHILVDLIQWNCSEQNQADLAKVKLSESHQNYSNRIELQ